MFEFGADEMPGLRNRIKEFRERRGLTQPQLGELIGVGHTTIGRLESGAIKLTADYMLSLGRALECEPIELVMDVEDAARTAEEAHTLRMMRAMNPNARENWLANGRLLSEKAGLGRPDGIVDNKG